MKVTQPQGREAAEKLAELLLEAQEIANELVKGQIAYEFGRSEEAIDYRIMHIRHQVLDSLDTTPF